MIEAIVLILGLVMVGFILCGIVYLIMNKV
jgi:hypothetical protein